MSDFPLLTQIEARVLGCLIEKKETTPDIYPLTLNALQAAANQKTSRDPVMTLEPADIHRAIKQLEEKGLVRRAFASRVERFEHRLGQQLNLLQPQTVLLSLMLLRGPQTAHELMARSERMANFPSVDELKEQLDLLIGRVPALVVQLDRAPGQREERFAHLLCGEIVQERSAHASDSASSFHSPASLEARVRALEEEVAALRAAIEARSA
jgi:uncharacterized protein YceH (UPF0502 family)